MKSRFNMLLGAGFLLTLVIIGVLSYRTFELNDEQNQAEAQVAHTTNVLMACEKLMTHVLETQSNQRTYLITQADKYLTEFQDGRVGIKEWLLKLRALTVDNPQQQQDIDQLEELIDQRIALLQANVTLRQRQGLEAIAKKIKGEMENNRMPEIRKKMLEIQQLESTLLIERQSQNQARIADFNRMFGYSTATILILFFGMFYLIYANLRSRTKVEDELRKSFHSLEESKRDLDRLHKRLSIAAEAGGVGIWDWDIVNNHLEWDAQMYRLYGLAPNAFGGAYASWQKGLHPEDLDRSNQEVQDALKGVKDFNTEFRIMWPDQSIHFIRAFAQVQRDEAGNPLRMIGTNWDVTQSKEMASQLEIRSQQLENTNRELESFTYSVSHDLRAPLRAINGYALALLDDCGNQIGEEGKRLLGIVMRNATRMGQLIDDLLAFSRLGRQPLSKAHVNMDDLVRQIVDELTSQSNGQQINVSIGELGSVHGDLSMLRQVWINLISNAIKYSSKKQQSIIHIGQSTTEKSPQTFYVRDNGAGFNMTYSDKLFGVFQRLHKANEFDGTGVGLALAKRVVSKHGGEIWAESVQEIGSVFYFTIPNEEVSEPMLIS